MLGAVSDQAISAAEKLLRVEAAFDAAEERVDERPIGWIELLAGSGAVTTAGSMLLHWVRDRRRRQRGEPVGPRRSPAERSRGSPP